MKIDRLIGIITLLLQKGQMTAPELAERFEVSRRTISRDIESLCKAGIPLSTSQGRGGGIFIMDGYSIDRTYLTSRELQAIFAGLRGLDNAAGTDQYRQLIEKLSLKDSSLLADTNHILIDLSSSGSSALGSKIQLIQDAIDRHCPIAFEYFAPAGDSSRRIEPYFLMFQWASWYVWGYCRDKKDFRMFKLNRLSDLHVLNEPFAPRKTPPLHSLSTSFPHEEIPVSAIIEPEMKWRLMEDFGAESFVIRPDGKLLFQFDFPGEEAVVGWILSFGDKAELVKPAGIRRKIRTLLENICAKYADH